MSDYEAHKGTLTPVITGSRDEITQYIRDNLKDKDDEFYEDEISELICYEEYYLYNDTLYKVDDVRISTDNEYFKADVKIGKIEYATMFYNGGCGLIDALDSCMDKIDV
jgi:hypothetical protein